MINPHSRSEFFNRPRLLEFVLVVEQELDYLVGAVSTPKRPFAAIVGGSKVSSKIGVIESLLEKCDILLLGGGMVFTFYKAQGLSVGSALVENDKLDLATSLLEKAKARSRPASSARCCGRSRRCPEPGCGRAACR